MNVTAELTIYFISFLIISGMGMIVYTMKRAQENSNRRFTFLRNQINTLMIRAGVNTKGKELEGELDLTHPKTGEKLKAKAKFRLE